MANELYCMGCMQPISEFSDKCYHCGYPVAGQNPKEFLPVRTQLGERYIVGRVLEQRADAAVYIGFDKTERAAVLVREFFPDGIVDRLSRQVVAKTGYEPRFERSLEQFRRQSRIIARMRDLPAIIPIYDMFEENGTMYTVADQVEGVSFRRYLETLGGHMSWEAARPLFVPLFTSLVSMHAAGLYHLGISPDSVLVDANNRLRIDGWQLAATRQEGKGLRTVLPSGYAAPEQYRTDATLSQEADVYALGATMLYALTGEEPPSAPDRENRVASLLVPADVAEKWPTHIAPTLCDALMLNIDKRIKTVELLRERLTVAPVVKAPREDAAEELAEQRPQKRSVGYKIAVGVLSALCVLLALALTWVLFIGNPFEPADDKEETVATTTTTTTTTTTATTRSTESQFAVADVVGLSVEEAAAKLLEMGNMTLHVKGREYSDTVPMGVIVSQDPMPQTYIDPGSVVEVQVSGGNDDIVVYDLAGWERDAARMYLEALGFRVTENEVTVSQYERGRVDCVTPAPGTVLSYGAEVVLSISAVDPTTTTTTTTTRNYQQYYYYPGYTGTTAIDWSFTTTYNWNANVTSAR